MDKDKQLARDLSIAYATVKLNHAMATNSLSPTLAPTHVNEMEYFLDEFHTAYEYYYRAVGVCVEESADSE